MSKCEWFIRIYRITTGQPLEVHGELRYPAYDRAEKEHRTMVKSIARWNNEEEGDYTYFVSNITHIRYLGRGDKDAS